MQKKFDYIPVSKEEAEKAKSTFEFPGYICLGVYLHPETTDLWLLIIGECNENTTPRSGRMYYATPVGWANFYQHQQLGKQSMKYLQSE